MKKQLGTDFFYIIFFVKTKGLKVPVSAKRKKFFFFFSKLLSIDILQNNEHFCIKIIYLTVGKA